jgi:GR25 family glycosyltransferase involved in LPS biosynthesis
MLNNFFDCVYVINLKRRADRLDHITNELRKINTTFKLIEAVDGNDVECNLKVGNGWNYKGVTGCAYSHKKVFIDALANNYKQIIVVEDDNIFADNFNELFQSFIKQVPDNWDMLYFGGNHQAKTKAININVERLVHTYTTNCYAIRCSIIPDLLKYLPENTRELTMPIDVLLTSIQKKGACYSHKPHICWQLGDFSDIENKQQEISYLKSHSIKASLIISSFNQAKRLKFSLQSAILQAYENYEVILADDNSTDNTINMVKNLFPGVKISLNKKSQSNKYTLADNWNTAAQLASGERLIFTNGDNLFSSGFVAAHMDVQMKNDIIFGPNERSTDEIEPLLDSCTNHLEILRSIKTIERDLRHDDSAYTYNQLYNTWYPWGNNFSIPTKIFKDVGGFPPRDYYGGEEKELLDNVVAKFNTPIKSNKHTYTLHLWHPQYNNTKSKERAGYKL